MEIVHRDFTLGDLRQFGGDVTAADSLTITPIYTLASSGTSMITAEPATYAIADGVIVDGENAPLVVSLAMGQSYSVALRAARMAVVPVFAATVSDASADPLTFAELYASTVPIQNPQGAQVREGDDINRLDLGEATNGQVLGYDSGAQHWGPTDAGAGDMLGANNLNDVADPSAARTNLGLGSAATKPAAAAGTAGAVLNADDPTTTNVRAPTAHKSTHATGGTDVLTPGDIGAATTTALTAEASTRSVADAALQTDINTRALASTVTAHTSNTSNPHSVTKAQVGLGSADDTNDLAKPVSTAQQAALDLKASLASPALTGVPTMPTAAPGTNTTQGANCAFVQAALAGIPASGFDVYAILDHYTAGSDGGGTFAAGSYQIHPLTRVVLNNSTALSAGQLLNISNYKFTLEGPGWEYLIIGSLQAQAVNQHQTALASDDDVYFRWGKIANANSGQGIRNDSLVIATPVPSANTVYKFYHIGVSPVAGYGFGDAIAYYWDSVASVPGGHASENVYSIVLILRKPVRT